MLAPEENITDTNFSAVPGNLGDFMSSIKRDEEESEENYFGGSQETEEPLDFNDNDSGTEAPIPNSVSSNIGRASARFTDRCASFIMGLIAHGDSRDYRADSEEISDLEEAFANYFAETGFNMSPTGQLVMAIMAIYVFKFREVMSDRKRNIELEQIEAQKKLNKQSSES